MKNFFELFWGKGHISKGLRAALIALILVYVLTMIMLMPVMEECIGTAYAVSESENPENNFADNSINEQDFDNDDPAFSNTGETVSEGSQAAAKNWNQEYNRNAEVLHEDVSKRSADSKQFLMDDGSYTLLQYSDDVHYKDGDEFKEIDNTLIKTDTHRLENKNNSFKVSLPEFYELGSKTTVSFGKYKIGFSLKHYASAADIIAKIFNRTNRQKISENGDYDVEVKNDSSVTYDSIGNIDLSYQVLGNKLKENILIKTRQSDYSFEFDINVNHLDLSLDDDGNILALNSDNEVIFIIPKGYMFDANGETSEAVTYELTKKWNIYTLCVKADSSWVNADGRAFPVTVDPIVTVPANGGSVTTGSRKPITGDNFLQLDNNSECFIKFSEPNLPLGATIVGASLDFAVINPYQQDFLGFLYECDKEWVGNPVTTSFFFNSDTVYLPDQQFMIKAGNYRYSLDVSRNIKNWWEFDRSNYGFAIKLMLVTSMSTPLTIPNQNNADTESRPALKINYRQNVGLESYWDYDMTGTSQETVYINKYNNQLTVLHDDVTTGGEFPIALQHVYLSAYKNVNYDVDGIFGNYNFGYGWKLNLQQIIRCRGNDFEYYDADGTMHYFKYNSDKGYTEDEDGLGLKIYNFDGSAFQMRDKENNISYFDNHGRMFKTQDRNGNVINIIYGNGNQPNVANIPLNEINDGKGRAINFTYDANGLLQKITYKKADGASISTNYTYSNGYLTKINNNDGTFSTYAYTTKNGLTGLEDQNAFNVQLSPISLSLVNASSRESYYGISVEEGFRVTNGIKNLINTFDNLYFNGNTVHIQAKENRSFYQLRQIDKNGNIVLDPNGYFFYNLVTESAYDSVGRLVSTYIAGPEITTTISRRYTEEQSNRVNSNKIVAETTFESNGINYLKNMSFDDNTDYWVPETLGNSVFTNVQSSDRYSYSGDKSMELFVAQPSRTELRAKQAVRLPMGSYIFCGYLKISDTAVPCDINDYGAFIGVLANNTQLVSDTLILDTLKSDNGFKYYYIKFTLDSAQDVTLFAGLKNCSGFAYFDALQLVKDDYGNADTFSLVENGGFERVNGTVPEGWTTSYANRIATSNVSQPVFSNMTMRVNGMLDECINIYQLAKLPKITQPMTYTISAWVNGMGRISLPKSSSNVGIEFYVDYADGHNEYHRLRFLENNPFWHQEAQSFIVNPGAVSVQIYIQVRETLSILFIDNVSLVKSQLINYEYDNYGNNSAYIDAVGNRYEYNESGEKVNISKGSVSQYGVIKDANGNVLSSTDFNRNIKSSFTYDQYGRVISETTQSTLGGKVISSTSAYSDITANFQRTLTETDGLGFKTISNYYAFGDVLQSAVFNDGSSIGYEYVYDETLVNEVKSIIVHNRDKAGNTLNTTVYNYYLSDEWSALTYNLGNTAYRYKSIGMLKSVETDNGTIYGYVYDCYGSVELTLINGYVQVQYYYRPLDRRLFQKRLANQYWEQYVYDNMGRMSQLWTKTSDSASFEIATEWEYTVRGNLARMKDYANDKLYEYQYDVNGRLLIESVGKLSTEKFDTYFEYVYDSFGNLSEKNVIVPSDAPKMSLTSTELISTAGDMSRGRNGHVETVSINGEVKITYTYSAANPKLGYLIREDNALNTSADYPDGITVVYRRDSDGKVTGFDCSEINKLNANKIQYDSGEITRSQNYVFDQGNVNIWDFDWMVRNQPNNTYPVSKIADTEYNGIKISNIIRIHHGSFFDSNTGCFSLVNPAALKSGVQNNVITFWARLQTTVAGMDTVRVPNIRYSDGTISPYQQMQLNTEWQTFSITLAQGKTPVSMEMSWYNGLWLEIGNVEIYAKKLAWDTEWAKNNIANSSVPITALTPQKINGNEIADIIRVHSSTNYIGSYNGVEDYQSFVNPELLANGGDRIKLSYSARIDVLNSDWAQLPDKNSRIRGLRFRYNDGSIDYGGHPDIAYNTDWQSISIVSAAGKVVTGIELGYNYGSWVLLGNISVECGNLKRLDGRVSAEKMSNEDFVTYGYDALGRLESKNVFGQNGDANSKLAETYSYLNGSGNNTTYTVTSKAITYGISNGITYNYTYCMDNPALGNVKTERANPYNIWQIKEGSTVKATYSYDLLGRLIREDNAYLNATVTYTYDGNNNLLNKTTYAFTTGALPASGGTVKSYIYGDTTFKDRLTSYNGQNVTYDALGNPLSYLGNTLTWSGRELSSFNGNGNSLLFGYDASGIRLYKDANGVRTEYLYDGAQLLRETKGDDTIWYLYEQDGLAGFELNGVSYYYIRNYSGDVTAIIDSAGNSVVQYAYDSWGKVLSVTGSLADSVGAKNPIRFRGYYYDSETGLYYLNSRYYDAETGRFISPDVVAEGGNVYTYCQNDPVNRSDESGYLSKFWRNIIKIAIGVVATIAAVAITVATGGAALPVVAGVVASTLIGGVVGGVTSVVNGGDFSEGFIDGASDGMMWGGIFALGSAAINAAKAGYSASQISANVVKTGNGSGAGANKSFATNDKLITHFNKHANEFEGMFSSTKDYIAGANYVINTGTYVPEANAYVKFLGAGGKANYAFVGMSQDMRYITTFGVRSVNKLVGIIPWLG